MWNFCHFTVNKFPSLSDWYWVISPLFTGFILAEFTGETEEKTNRHLTFTVWPPKYPVQYKRFASLNAIIVVIEPFRLLSTDIAINLLSTFETTKKPIFSFFFFKIPKFMCSRVVFSVYFFFIRVMKSTTATKVDAVRCI